MKKRQMHLIGVMTTGPMAGLWTNPFDGNDYLDERWWVSLAQTMERAKFDAFFLADSTTFMHGDELVRRGSDLYLLDPVPLTALIAANTSKIGLGLTISSTTVEPYHIARSTRTLDVLSGGRVAWNVVTTGYPSLFDVQRLGKEEGYAKAHEVLEACTRLWDSFPPGAYVVDKRQNAFIDPEQLKPVGFRGKYVATAGTLSVPPSAQDRPVIMQAGSSPVGRDFAARWAEIIFTYQRTKESFRAFRADMNTRLEAVGRSADDVVILPALGAFLGETEEIARARHDYVLTLLDEDTALQRASQIVQFDLRSIRHERTFDIELIEDPEARASGAIDAFLDTMTRENLTILETARRWQLNDLAPVLVGTPTQVADAMEEMYDEWGVDGFALIPSVQPAMFEDIARTVVPLLQQRGRFRTDYEGDTLRAHIFASES